MQPLTVAACVAALLALAACGSNTTERAATGGLGGSDRRPGGRRPGRRRGRSRRRRRRRRRYRKTTAPQCRLGCAPVPSSSSTRPEANRSILSRAAAGCGAPVAIRCAKHQPEAGVALNPP